MSEHSVTFETKVWEGDFRVVLDPHRLDGVVRDNAFDFDRRIVVVNNVDNVAAVARKCRALIRAGVIDDYAVAAEHAGAALGAAGITASELGTGYKYSIAELVGIYVCATTHLLHFSGDARPTERVEWLPAALALLAERDEVKVVNLVWNALVEQVREESFSESGGFWFGRGFSDQMYLVRAAEFQQPIYSESHPESARYPAYGGELFEKRVDSWLRNHDYLRATSGAGSYTHENIAPHRSVPDRVTRRLLGRLRGR